jgi:hypothetical protein
MPDAQSYTNTPSQSTTTHDPSGKTVITHGGNDPIHDHVVTTGAPIPVAESGNVGRSQHV